jgi:hypothetical protein
MPEDIDFHDELARISSVSPFVPFTIATTSDARFFVSDAESIIVANDVVTVLRPKASSVLIRVYSIESIELHELIR